MYIFAFTIGPVQPFIEKSRKVREMYAGSKILSILMGKILDEIAQYGDTEIIIPKITKDPDDLNIPNRCIVEVKKQCTKHPQDIGKELSELVKKEFENLYLEILERFGIKEKGIEFAKKQLQDFLECHWAYVEYETTEKYSEAYKKIFKLINEAKGIRMFQQTSEPAGRKCMLFPEYNAIFVRKKSDGDFSSQVRVKDVYDLEDNVLKPGEALSSIALIKRLYGWKLQSEKDNEINSSKDVLNEKKNKVTSIRCMLLESRNADLLEEISIKHEDFANALYDQYNQTIDYDGYNMYIEKEAKDFFSKHKGELSFPNYYALVKFDGDSMGDAFISLASKAKDNKEAKTLQGCLSAKIGKFASEVLSIIDEYKGMSIYAGGEDFFGILPLDTLMDCMAKLDNEFFKDMELTFSVGIAIGHVMQPLKHVVALVDEMEKVAKSKVDKHAFAIGLLKRSGDAVKLPAYKLSNIPNQVGSNDEICLVDIKDMITYLNDSKISKSLIYNINAVLHEYIQSELSGDEKIIEVLLKQNVYLVENKYKHKHDETSLKLLYKFFKAGNIAGALDTLNAIAFIAREVKI